MLSLEKRVFRHDILLGVREIPVASQDGSSLLSFFARSTQPNILRVGAIVLGNRGEEARQATQPFTVYFVIDVSTNMLPPTIPDNPPEIQTKADDTPAEEATKLPMIPDSGTLIQLCHLSVETETTMPHIQAEEHRDAVRSDKYPDECFWRLEWTHTVIPSLMSKRAHQEPHTSWLKRTTAFHACVRRICETRREFNAISVLRSHRFRQPRDGSPHTPGR